MRISDHAVQQHHRFILASVISFTGGLLALSFSDHQITWLSITALAIVCASMISLATGLVAGIFIRGVRDLDK